MFWRFLFVPCKSHSNARIYSILIGKSGLKYICTYISELRLSQNREWDTRFKREVQEERGMTVRWRGQEGKGGQRLFARKETAWDCLD